MNKKEEKEYKNYLKSVGDYMAEKGYTVKPLPKVILDEREQDSDVFCYTGYFDTNSNAVRLFTNNRLKKDVLRTWAHELIHWKQQQDGTIEQSGYNGDKITEDKNLVKLESEAYLKGNIAFRSWTEEMKHNGKHGIVNENLDDGQDGKITPDIAWMEAMYNKANKELFRGELGGCTLRVGQLPYRTLGNYRMAAEGLKCKNYNRKMFVYFFGNELYIGKDNFRDRANPIITLNSSYRASETSWYNTLVHEMCHYYTYMYGYAPKQGHGVEFREIASLVSSRSNGTITVQRLANAEESKDYELDGEIQAQVDKKKQAKMNGAHYIIVIHSDDDSVELINTRNESLINIIAQRAEVDGNKCIELINTDYANALFNEGYNKTMKVYKYWEISKNDAIMSKILSDSNNYRALN